MTQAAFVSRGGGGSQARLARRCGSRWSRQNYRLAATDSRPCRHPSNRRALFGYMRGTRGVHEGHVREGHSGVTGAVPNFLPGSVDRVTSRVPIPCREQHQSAAQRAANSRRPVRVTLPIARFLRIGWTDAVGEPQNARCRRPAGVHAAEQDAQLLCDDDCPASGCFAALVLAEIAGAAHGDGDLRRFALVTVNRQVRDPRREVLGETSFLSAEPGRCRHQVRRHRGCQSRRQPLQWSKAAAQQEQRFTSCLEGVAARDGPISLAVLTIFINKCIIAHARRRWDVTIVPC